MPDDQTTSTAADHAESVAVDRSFKSLAITLVLCLAFTAAAGWAGRHAYGVNMRLHHIKGTVEKVELSPHGTGRVGDDTKNAYTQMFIRDEAGEVRGPFKLGGDQRSRLEVISRPVRLMYDHNHLVAELKDDMETYVTLQSWVRKRHISRVVAVIAMFFLGAIAFSMWSSLFKLLLGRPATSTPQKTDAQS
jgi:hypothetical protein